MNKDQWDQLQRLYDEAQPLGAEARNALISRVAQQDAEIADQLKRMLEAPEDRAGSLVDGALEEFSSSGDQEAEILTQLGPYRLLESIGAGGMGRVYLGERSDGAFDRQVAVKVVKRGMDSDEMLTRFRLEQQILARLEHPHIARLLDAGIGEDGRLYYVMEYVDGQPIHRYCDEHRLSIGQRLELFSRVCEAVQYAHQALVVHRDLKPSNILVSADGQVKLLDFGIAKLLDAPDAALTRTGEAVLTPDYAAPEQILRQTITTAVDIYALGVLLFELLAGARPFEAEAEGDRRERILNTDPLPPSRVISRARSGRSEAVDTHKVETSRQLSASQLERRLKGDLDNICLKALRRQPKNRYRSADQLSEDVDRYRRGLPIIARPHSLGYRMGRFLKRHTMASAATLGALALVVSLITFYTQRLAQERDTAIAEQHKTRAVVDFVTNMLLQADPGESLGEKVTVGSVLDAAVDRLDTELTEQPEVRARLLAVLGEVKYVLSDSDEAESLLREALEGQLAAYGETHLDTATTQLLLAFIHQGRGAYDEAGALLDRSEATRRQLLPLSDPRIVEVISAQAELTEFEGDYPAAETLYREALRLARLADPPSQNHVASALTNLGGLLRIIGQNKDAEQYLNDALVVFEQLYPDGHPDMSGAQRQLAGLLRDTGRHEDAKALYEQLIADRERMLGPTHIEVAHSYNSYSQLLSAMGENAAAAEAQQKMIDLIRDHHGDPHPSLAAAYNNMAFFKRALDDLEGAIEFFELSAREQEKLGLDPDHINRSFPLGGKSIALIELGRFDEAEPLVREALRIRGLSLSPDHRRMLELRLDLGKVLTALEHFEEAETVLLAIFDSLATNEEQTAKRQEAARRLLTLYEATGAAEKAIPLQNYLDTAAE